MEDSRFCVIDVARRAWVGVVGSVTDWYEVLLELVLPVERSSQGVDAEHAPWSGRLSHDFKFAVLR